MSFEGPFEWGKRLSPSIDVFKRELKTHFFHNEELAPSVQAPQIRYSVWFFSTLDWYLHDKCMYYYYSFWIPCFRQMTHGFVGCCFFAVAGMCSRPCFPIRCVWSKALWWYFDLSFAGVGSSGTSSTGDWMRFSITCMRNQHCVLVVNISTFLLTFHFKTTISRISCWRLVLSSVWLLRHSGVKTFCCVAKYCTGVFDVAWDF